VAHVSLHFRVRLLCCRAVFERTFQASLQRRCHHTRTPSPSSCIHGGHSLLLRLLFDQPHRLARHPERLGQPRPLDLSISRQRVQEYVAHAVLCRCIRPDQHPAEEHFNALWRVTYAPHTAEPPDVLTFWLHRKGELAGRRVAHLHSRPFSSRRNSSPTKKFANFLCPLSAAPTIRNEIVDGLEVRTLGKRRDKPAERRE
jgi:hypothetical protein